MQDTEQTWWDELSIDFMSFESSDEEDVINVHSLPWRSKSKSFRDYMYASNCDWSNIYIQN